MKLFENEISVIEIMNCLRANSKKQSDERLAKILEDAQSMDPIAITKLIRPDFEDYSFKKAQERLKNYLDDGNTIVDALFEILDVYDNALGILKAQKLSVEKMKARLNEKISEYEDEDDMQLDN